MSCEKKNVICNSSIKICLKKRKKKEKKKENIICIHQLYIHSPAQREHGY